MALPTRYKRLAVFEPGADFRTAARIVDGELKVPAANEVLIRNLYAGVNASDPVATSGGYGFSELPFEIGIEGGGEIVAVGEGVADLKVGDHGLVFGMGAYGEYRLVPASQVIPVLAVTPAVISAFIAGITASVGLSEAALLRAGETILVTAAAGGVGSFAVQLARLAGARVIGTCGDDAKAEWLRTLGCDRVINYRRENLDAALQRECPRGIDFVFESVGRQTFDTALRHLAPFGRLIVIGAVSEYGDGLNWEKVEGVRVYQTLLGKSASIHGCFLPLYPQEVWMRHLDRVRGLVADGTLIAAVDPTEFHGVDAIADAVAYLHAGRNRGKVVIRFP